MDALPHMPQSFDREVGTLSDDGQASGVFGLLHTSTGPLDRDRHLLPDV